MGPHQLIYSKYLPHKVQQQQSAQAHSVTVTAMFLARRTRWGSVLSTQFEGLPMLAVKTKHCRRTSRCRPETCLSFKKWSLVQALYLFVPFLDILHVVRLCQRSWSLRILSLLVKIEDPIQPFAKSTAEYKARAASLLALLSSFAQSNICNPFCPTRPVLWPSRKRNQSFPTAPSVYYLAMEGATPSAACKYAAKRVHPVVRNIFNSKSVNMLKDSWKKGARMSNIVVSPQRERVEPYSPYWNSPRRSETGLTSFRWVRLSHWHYGKN